MAKKSFSRSSRPSKSRAGYKRSQFSKPRVKMSSRPKIKKNVKGFGGSKDGLMQKSDSRNFRQDGFLGGGGCVNPFGCCSFFMAAPIIIILGIVLLFFIFQQF